MTVNSVLHILNIWKQKKTTEDVRRLMMNKIMFKDLKYFRKQYYSGMIRWLVIDKNKNNISCRECGNIANGIIKTKSFGFVLNMPYCKSHLGDIYFNIHKKARSIKNGPAS